MFKDDENAAADYEEGPMETIEEEHKASETVPEKEEVAAAVEVGSVRWGQLHTGNVKNLLALRKYAGGVISGLHIF